jgi:hypothetical protein
VVSVGAAATYLALATADFGLLSRFAITITVSAVALVVVAISMRVDS